MNEVEQNNNGNKFTYSTMLTCTNCGNKTFRNITKGITVRDYISLEECNVCGCTTLTDNW